MERLDPLGPPPSPLQVDRMAGPDRVTREHGGSGGRQRRPASRRREPDPDDEPQDDVDESGHVDISA